MESAKLKPADLARATKSTNAAVGFWLDGTTKSLKAEKAQLLETATGYRAMWLVSEKGPKMVSEADIKAPISIVTSGIGQNQAVVEIGNYRGKNKPDEFVIPEFNTGGAMGRGLLLRDQPGVIRGWSVNQEWLSKNIKSHSGASNLCIVTGFGDSMKGMFNPGDPLVVDRGVTTVEFDAVYFFRVENEGFIKRLQRIPGEGLRVLSENKKYDSWTIRPDMEFEVFGRVLKAWQSEEF